MSLRNRLLTILRTIDDRISEAVGPQRILFVASDGYGFACQSPVIRQLEGRPNLILAVTVPEGESIESFTCTSPEDAALFQRLAVAPSRARLAKWSQVVYSHLSNFYPRRGTLKAYMHHGAGFGSGGGFHAAQACDIYLGLSNAEREYLEKQGQLDFTRDKVFFPIGFPKSDRLLNNLGSDVQARRRLDLPERKTLMIASAQNPRSLARTLGARPFQMLADAFPDWNVVQHGHPWLWEIRDEADRTWKTRLRQDMQHVDATHPNAYFAPELDVDVLVSASNLLIADITSVVTSFCLLNKPVAIFDNPDSPLAKSRAASDYLNAAQTFSTPESLPETCTRALEDHPDKEVGRQAIRERFYAHAGRSAEETARILLQIGRTCSIRGQRWKDVLRLANSQAMDH